MFNNFYLSIYLTGDLEEGEEEDELDTYLSIYVSIYLAGDLEEGEEEGELDTYLSIYLAGDLEEGEEEDELDTSDEQMDISSGQLQNKVAIM